jgi:hypothetical protein
LGWLKCWPSCHCGGSDNIVASAMLEACVIMGVIMGCWFQTWGDVAIAPSESIFDGPVLTSGVL